MSKCWWDNPCHGAACWQHSSRCSYRRPATSSLGGRRLRIWQFMALPQAPQAGCQPAVWGAGICTPGNQWHRHGHCPRLAASKQLGRQAAATAAQLAHSWQSVSLALPAACSAEGLLACGCRR